MFNEALNNGEDKLTLKHVIEGLGSGLGSGATGFRIGQYNDEEHNYSSIKEEDYQKYPTFKKVKEEWGMELPNTVHSSEVITDEKNKTKKKLSDYSQETQDRYDKVHNENLNKELQSIFNNRNVFVKIYKDKDGVEISEVSLTKDKGEKPKKISDLNESERAQILRIAQSKATEKTKKQIFK